MSTNSQTKLILNNQTQVNIISQLNRILSSESFRDSRQASNFLSFVTQAVLSGQTQNVKQYTIAVDALGYSVDFDPQTNPSIRNLAARVRVMLERYYFHEGKNDAIRIEIPKRSYIPIFWIDSMPMAEAQSSKSLQDASTSHAEYGLSIAVIPFSNQTPDENSIYDNSITESIAMRLSQFREISVIGPLEEYKDHPFSMDDIVQRYRTRFILHGRVYLHDNILRITVSLTDTSTGSKRWSHTYEYTQEDTNFISIGDNLAQRIVSALVDYCGIIPSVISRESMKKNCDNLEAFDAIFRYEHCLAVFTKDAFHAALQALERVVKVDSGNSIALAMLSNAYCCNYMYDLGFETGSLEEAERLALLAIEIDPDCQFAHLSHAYVRFNQGQTERCLAALNTSVLSNPFNSFILHACGCLFCMLGHWEKGMELWETAMNLNPTYPPVVTSVTPFMYNYCQLKNYNEARKYAVRFSTGIYWQPLVRAAVAGQLGLQDEATSALQELIDMRPDFVFRARDLLKRVLFCDDNVETLLDGLFKAGLELNPC